MNPNENAYRQLKQWQKALGLTNSDTGLANVQPDSTDPNQPKPEDLELYEEMFREAAERQIPIQERDRRELEYFQQIFHLREEDIVEIEQRVLAEIEIPGNIGSDAYPDTQEDRANFAPQSFRRSSPPIDSSGEGSTEPTLLNQTVSPNRAAMQDLLSKRRSDRISMNPGPTQPPNEFVARSAPVSDPAIASPETAPASSTPAPPPSVPTAQKPVAPPVTAQAQPPETVMQTSEQPGVVSSTQVQPAQPIAPLPSTPVAIPDAATKPPTLSKRIIPFDKPSLIIFFGFLAALTSLGVIWWMARPYFQSTTTDPQAAQQFMQRGTQNNQASNYQAAIADFNEAIRLNRNDVNAYINRGFAHHRLRNLNAAADDYTKAIELNKNSAEAHSNLSHVRFDQGNFSEAAKLAQRALELKPNFPEAHLNLGNAMQAENNLERATAEFQKVLQLPASNITKARAHNNRGNIFFIRKNFSEAGKEYDQAIQIDPSYADAFFNRGLVNERSGNPQAAIRDFTDAARLYREQKNDRRSQEAQRRAEQLQQANPTTSPPPTQTPNTTESI